MKWEVKNHGGIIDPSENKKYAVFVGRFQPYHNAHIELIKQKIDEGKPVLIMVRDVIPDYKNPYTAEQSKQLIERYHNSKGDDVKVIIIPDIESFNFGRNVGYEVNEFIPPKGMGWVSATTIRNCLKNGDDYWKTMVDESIQDDVLNYLSVNENVT
jgi:cytidyltransferase-like protein